LEKPKKDFIYDTLETEENPMLAFRISDAGWNIFSVWERFRCEQTFTFEEVEEFMRGIVAKVVCAAPLHLLRK
jgi:hypothetical protein